MANKPMQAKYAVGVDGGGSHCRAIIVDQNNTIVGRGEGGPANAYQNIELAKRSIINAVDSALRDMGAAVDKSFVLAMGLAGLNVSSVKRQLIQWPNPWQAQGAHTFYTTDLHIAHLGAHAGADGAVIVVGTGSCAYASVNGLCHSIGGHGFPCGDKAGGAWFGLRAVQQVLLSADALAPPSCLTRALCDYFQITDVLLLVEKLSGAGQHEYAKLAPLVFNAADVGDELALTLLVEAADYIQALIIKLQDVGAKRISLLGGIAQRLSLVLASEFREYLSPALESPMQGAVRFARAEYAAYHGYEAPR